MLMTREKEETEIIKKYENCLKMMNDKCFEKGVESLKLLLEEKIIQEKDFDNLRYSCFISLATVYENELKLINEALYYLNKAININ